MKLNFWQWLGIVLIVIGVAWWIYSRRAATPAPTPTATPPAATAPVR